MLKLSFLCVFVLFSFSTGAWDEKWKVVYEYSIGKTLLKVMQEWKSNFECRALTSSRSSTILLRMSVSSLLWHISAVTTPGGKRQGSQCAVCVCVCVYFSALVACECLHAFAPATLDEEADEIEERRVSVLPVKLSPVVDHRLLTHHKQATMCVLTWSLPWHTPASPARSVVCYTCMARRPIVITSNRVTASTCFFLLWLPPDLLPLLGAALDCLHWTFSVPSWTLFLRLWVGVRHERKIIRLLCTLDWYFSLSWLRHEYFLFTTEYFACQERKGFL